MAQVLANQASLAGSLASLSAKTLSGSGLRQPLCLTPFSRRSAQQTGSFGCRGSRALSGRVLAAQSSGDQRVEDVEVGQLNDGEAVGSIDATLFSIAFAVAPFLLDTEQAFAQGREFGFIEGRIMSLVHPVAMGAFLLLTLWAGYLGWQWRRVRTVQDEINDLKKQLPPKGEDGVTPASPIDAKIKELTETRKDLVKGGFRDRHFNAGSILLGGGTTLALAGVTNTYLRTGKLFPGPHLYAGGVIIALWAAAASLVPAMQKGSDTARSLHIGLNTANLALFLWQVPTGLDIVWKVLEFTTLP